MAKKDKKGLVEVKKPHFTHNTFKKPKAVGKIKLTPKRRQMINETINALVSSNFNKERASKLLDISVQALYSRFKKYPQIQEQANYYNKLTIDLVKKKIEQFSEKGADNVISLAEGARSEKVKLNANLELLDRAGITKPQQNNNIQVNVLNQMKKQADQYDL